MRIALSPDELLVGYYGIWQASIAYDLVMHATFSAGGLITTHDYAGSEPHDTRGPLLESATTAFATHGYDAASIRSVERAAGVERVFHIAGVALCSMAASAHFDDDLMRQPRSNRSMTCSQPLSRPVSSDRPGTDGFGEGRRGTPGGRVVPQS
ncbi:hypothetical protein ACFY2R_18455 [Micromonospora olivasterospora]|uniref:TetR family transcriptional regulator n=1 Tax=Micromonospora olivasterospora TaxID=1880 RepID=A0A562I3R6_MICOL|nr:hypothetical protein [Micromonospora olivasterospora]TWH65315.1 hypothetical protein JD77_00251 [Micromonospora olivasterospora]